MSKITEQKQLEDELQNVFRIFKASEGKLRPHFILTGESGSGKSHVIKTLCESNKLNYMEVNAAQLTKEGVSGNSLSKALSPLINMNGPTVCFVDEFDKMFISGNSNSQLAHESTNGVQNEFLKVLESDTTSVYGDYGKYVSASCENVLFIFAGAFNNEPDVTIDRLREFGVKTEFLGRVGLVFNTSRIGLDSLYKILENSDQLKMYCELYPNVDKISVINLIKEYLQKNYENNTLGIRIINTLIHKYFIKNGKLEDEDVKHLTFQTKLSFD